MDQRASLLQMLGLFVTWKAYRIFPFHSCLHTIFEGHKTFVFKNAAPTNFGLGTAERAHLFRTHISELAYGLCCDWSNSIPKRDVQSSSNGENISGLTVSALTVVEPSPTVSPLPACLQPFLRLVHRTGRQSPR